MSDSILPCRGCGGTGDNWDNSRGDWGSGQCSGCAGSGTYSSRHSNAIDAARSANYALEASGLTESQHQSLIDLMNALQELNTLYWDEVKR